MTRTFHFLIAFVILFAPGCVVTQEVIDTVSDQASGNDRYHELAESALAGEKAPGLEPISAEDLRKTPRSVRILAERLLESLHANRFAARSALFQMDQGPDPATLGLKPLALPEPEDASSGLLEDK